MTKTIAASRVIPLTKGCVAIISAVDFRRVNRHKWCVTQSAGKKRSQGKFYAKATIKGKKVYLHRFVMNTPPDQHCDHINYCTLDCRQENLQNICSKENLKRRRIKTTKKAES